MVIKRPPRQRYTPRYLPEVQSRVPLDKSQDLASLRTLKSVFFADPFVPEISDGLQGRRGSIGAAVSWGNTHSSRKSQSGIGSTSCTFSPDTDMPGSFPTFLEGRTVYSVASATDTSSTKKRIERMSSRRSLPDLVLVEVEGV